MIRKSIRTKAQLGIPRWVAAIEGSFADPPIVFRQDRLKLFLLSLCLVIFDAVLLRLSAPNYSNFALFLVGLLGFAGAVFCWKGAFPATLILGPDGLVRHTSFGAHRYEWSDFLDFRTVTLRGLLVTIDVDFSSNAKGNWIWRTGSFGAFWELPAQKVVDVLNEARGRWR